MTPADQLATLSAAVRNFLWSVGDNSALAELMKAHDAAIEAEAAQPAPHDERSRALVEAVRRFSAVHNPECPVASWAPESRTLRICHCGLEGVRAALSALEDSNA